MRCTLLTIICTDSSNIISILLDDYEPREDIVQFLVTDVSFIPDESNILYSNRVNNIGLVHQLNILLLCTVQKQF